MTGDVLYVTEIAKNLNTLWLYDYDYDEVVLVGSEVIF